jgi:hypothetical protein
MDHNALELVTAGPAHYGVFSGALLASYDFVFERKKLNFVHFFPSGITNFSFATNTVAPGPPQFSVTFADAGWGGEGAHTWRLKRKLGLRIASSPLEEVCVDFAPRSNPVPTCLWFLAHEIASIDLPNATARASGDRARAA